MVTAIKDIYDKKLVSNNQQMLHQKRVVKYNSEWQKKRSQEKKWKILIYKKSKIMKS